MCGIATLINVKNQPVHPLSMQGMTRLVAHRGPDGEGYFFHENIAFGHRRLAIIDLSDAAAQPMTAFGSTIVYNGEMYNYLEIRAFLQSNGFVFQTQSDTEVILAAYQFWGQACVEQFNGMWAFVLFDPTRRRLFASRDRFGEKPLYYATVGNQFCFASEIKQFTTLPDWQGRLNKQTATAFFKNSLFDHSADTFFEGVYQIRGGENLIYDLTTHQFHIKRYYDLAEKIKNAPPLPKESCGQYSRLKNAQEEFFALFSDAVKLRMRSDVPVGTSLSGGLDSGSIAVLMSDWLSEKQVVGSQKSITAIYPNHIFDETRYAKAVGDKAKLTMYFTQPTAEMFLAQMNHMVWHQDEPLSTDSVFAQFMVFREAHRQNLKVMLDGQGGDEILGGYASFYKPFFHKLLKINPLQAFLEIGFYFKNYGFHEAAHTLRRKMTPQYPDYFLGFESKNQISAPQKKENPDLNPFQNRSLQLLTETFLPALLHFADRNAMAFSVESRLPFLDYRLVEFCLNLPDRFKIHRSQRKYILRQAMQNHLPKEVLRRKDKIGFFNPGEDWMRADPTRWYAEMKPIAEKWQPLFSQNVLPEFEKFLHRKPLSISESAFWKILFFGKWAEVFKIEPI